MKDQPKERIGSFFFAALITIVIIGSLVIIQEVSIDLRILLNKLTGHHWITKSVLAVILLPVLAITFYFILGSEKSRRKLKSDNVWLWVSLTVALTIIFILGSFFVTLVIT